MNISAGLDAAAGGFPVLPGGAVDNSRLRDGTEASRTQPKIPAPRRPPCSASPRVLEGFAPWMPEARLMQAARTAAKWFGSAGR